LNIFLILFFLFSALLLILTGLKITKCFTNKIADGFWILIGTMYLEISFITILLSIFKYLNAYSFILLQLLFFLIVFFYIRKRNLILPSKKYYFANFSNLDLLEKIMVFLIVALILISFFKRILTPLHSGDVLYYHASRILYWIQNSTIASYPTMNDRQIVFSFGSDLIFMWPVLLAKSEFIGRMVYWFGFPLNLLGLYQILSAMECRREFKLLGLSLFASAPIIFKFSTNLEPLIWVIFFSLGTAYFCLRSFRTRLNVSHVIFWFGVYSVLVGNAKNYGILLIPAGILVILFIGIFQIKNSDKKLLCRIITIHLSAIIFCLVISGLGFLMMQNKIIFGNLLASDLRKKQNIAEISPYQIYVHTVRLGAVLAECPIPIPLLNKKIEDFGNRIIKIIGADEYLPKEKEWGWVGHYKYKVPRLPTGNSFGLIGIFLLIIMINNSIDFLKIIKTKGLMESWKHIKKEEYFSYFLIALSLLGGTVYLLRWITCGTHSFIAPGLILMMPLAISSINKMNISRNLFRVFIVISILFVLYFTIFQTNELIKEVSIDRFDWSKISYTKIFHYELIQKYVPSESTLIVLIHSNFKDYSLFGKNYTRKVYQITESLDKNTITNIVKKHPGAFIYIDEHRYNANIEILDSDSRIKFLDQSKNAKLYKICDFN